MWTTDRLSEVLRSISMQMSPIMTLCFLVAVVAVVVVAVNVVVVLFTHGVENKAEKSPIGPFQGPKPTSAPRAASPRVRFSDAYGLKPARTRLESRRYAELLPLYFTFSSASNERPFPRRWLFRFPFRDLQVSIEVIVFVPWLSPREPILHDSFTLLLPLLRLLRRES